MKGNSIVYYVIAVGAVIGLAATGADDLAAVLVCLLVAAWGIPKALELVKGLTRGGVHHR
jgi:hypothetical protein